MRPPLSAYAELHCLSNFSFLRGASHPGELVERAVALGYRALAITDECSVAGAVRAHLAARDAGLALIVGSELRLDCGTRLVLLARDRAGYAWLARLITRGRRAAEKGEYHLVRADLEGAPRASLYALWLPGDEEQGRWVEQAFGAAGRLAVELHASGAERARLAELTALGQAL